MLIGAIALSQAAVAVPPAPRTPASEQVDRAAGAILSHDETAMRTLISPTILYDADDGMSQRIRGPERTSLDRVMKEIRGCNVNAVMRQDGVDAAYGVNWVCRYRMNGDTPVPHEGAHAILKSVGGRPTLVDFAFQGPWPAAPRTR